MFIIKQPYSIKQNCIFYYRSRGITARGHLIDPHLGPIPELRRPKGPSWEISG